MIPMYKIYMQAYMQFNRTNMTYEYDCTLLYPSIRFKTNIPPSSHDRLE